VLAPIDRPDGVDLVALQFAELQTLCRCSPHRENLS
jgi:hypothetical protein